MYILFDFNWLLYLCLYFYLFFIFAFDKANLHKKRTFTWRDR